MWPLISAGSSNILNGVEQALKSEKVSQMAKALDECESILISADRLSIFRGIYAMMSPVSSGACKLFLSSGSSVEAEDYRQLVVERFNNGDITTALKLCCIGHQIAFRRYKININQPISDAQTLKNIFVQMLRIGSYKQERTKFLSICNEWYRVLEFYSEDP